MSAMEEPEQEAQRAPEKERTQRPFGQMPDGGQEVPLFLRDLSDGWKGNPQDEKDEMGE